MSGTRPVINHDKEAVEFHIRRSRRYTKGPFADGSLIAAQRGQRATHWVVYALIGPLPGGGSDLFSDEHFDVIDVQIFPRHKLAKAARDALMMAAVDSYPLASKMLAALK